MESVYHIYKLIEFHLYYTKVNRMQFTPRTGRMLITSVMEYHPPSVPIKYGVKYPVIFKEHRSRSTNKIQVTPLLASNRERECCSCSRAFFCNVGVLL